MATSGKNYDEKGIVLKCSDQFTPDLDLTGKTIYFDAWQAAKYNEDTPEEFWLVPFTAIRAYE